MGTYTSEERHGRLRSIIIIDPIEEPCHFQGVFRLNDRHETKPERIPPVYEVHDGSRDESKDIRVREINNGNDVEHVPLDAMELSGMHRSEQLRAFA